ncbi:Integral membrane protein SYS1-related [Arabidopsis thaliana x Arabidopsis arenosa]|uniref:Integral membrane protein SYS1-related n=1 Tax=Arabidopsis thaliana x Arabidopsis arenosa TaxID=1240361 RepID=A0A8T2GY60_9BRAS|nr:Integral membrane protein SYS1-related [Arabidopsis thaliana x Arabidopsis arenosa]
MAMAEPDPDSSVDLKHFTTPLFSIPGFFSDSSDAGRSPTSPLDFGGLFSPRSSSSPLRNKWLSDKVGLSLLSSSLDLGHEASFRRDYIVLSPQIKNYAAPSLSDAVNIHSDLIVEEPRRSSSSPMDITSTQAYSRSLSGREMALSEDYTCIISHGPNPKTTHIFGDCILDCDPKEDIEMQEEGDDDSLPSTGKPQDHIDRMNNRAEKENEKAGVEDSSPGSSYKEEELFITPNFFFLLSSFLFLVARCHQDSLSLPLCNCKRAFVAFPSPRKEVGCIIENYRSAVPIQRIRFDLSLANLGLRDSYLAMFYGTAVWDPWLIVGQIICLQCSYYLTLGLFTMVFLGLRVPRLSLVYFFDYATLTTSTFTGWCVIASFLFSSLAGAVYMIFLVERARKCLDFSATLYIIHLFFCILYGGWPSSMAWWVVNGTGLAVMALLAEYLCIKREQREIPMDRFHSRV